SDPLAPFLPFIRVAAAPDTGTGLDNPRQQLNQITSFIDGSQVYGSDQERANFLRTLDGTGKLKSQLINGEELLPFNTAGFTNANIMAPIPDENMFIAGDVRANEQIGLTAVHTLFMREHNRLAEDLSSRLASGDAAILAQLDESELEEGDFIYESARKLVGAQIQVITYNEFLPLLIGDRLLDSYNGYNPQVDPAVSNEFANAAFRVGHTLLSPEIARVSDNGSVLATIPLGNAFFDPQEIIDNGIDSLLLGLASQKAQRVDNMLVDGVRNFLPPIPTGGFDLATINLARGRDIGLPSYNSARLGLGLQPVTSFLTTEDELGITSDPEVANLFASIYESVDDVDFWIGGISEMPINNGLVGELLNVVIKEQFLRTMAGDRFFYLNDLEHLLVLDPHLETTRLADLIRRNSKIKNIQDNAFKSSQPVPEPSSLLAWVILIAGAGYQLQRKN
ncbi:MAG: peroxiredoxin, partial [Okeania sp. SIO2D1]|nr:peroxiredoxin [Okeania sp. SIO2D1]